MDKKALTKCTKEIHTSSFQNSLKCVLISFKIENMGTIVKIENLGSI